MTEEQIALDAIELPEGELRCHELVELAHALNKRNKNREEARELREGLTRSFADLWFGEAVRTFRVTMRGEGPTRDAIMPMDGAIPYIRNHFSVFQLTGEAVLGVPYEGVSHG